MQKKVLSLELLSIFLFIMLSSLICTSALINAYTYPTVSTRGLSQQDGSEASNHYFWDGSPEDDIGEGIALDKDGSIYTVGSTWSDGYHPVIVKWNASGHQLWNQTWINTIDDLNVLPAGHGIAVDSNGSVYMIGSVKSEFVLFALLLVKWNGTGHQLWNRTCYRVFIGNHDFPFTRGYGVTVDNDGNIYTVGRATVTPSYEDYLLLVKWNASGHQLWTRVFDSATGSWGTGVTVDNKGDIYTIGVIEDKKNSFLALVKWNATGHQLWNQTWSKEGSNSLGWGIAVDSYGSVYTVGKSGSGLALVKWDNAGHQYWNCTWGEAYNAVGRGVTIGSDGYIYIVGSIGWDWEYRAQSKLAVSAGVPSGNFDLILMKWDTNGNLIGTKSWSKGSSYPSREISLDFGHGVTIDSNGNVYCVGYSYIPDNQYYHVLVIFSSVNFTLVDYPVPTSGLELPLAVFTICLLVFFNKKLKKRKTK